MANIIEIYNEKIKSDKLSVSKITSSATINDLSELNKKQEKFLFSIDYSNPKNFAKFGSAEEYYKTAINFIDKEYPYDGSTYEKNKWINSLNNLEYFLFLKEYPTSVGHVMLSQSQQIKVYSHVKEPKYLEVKEIYDYKKYSNNTLLDLSSDNGICFESWIKFAFKSQQSKIFSLNALSVSDNIQNIKVFEIYSFNSYLFIKNYNSDATVLLPIPDSNWHHYSFNIDKNKISVFIDGVLKVTKNIIISEHDQYIFNSKGLFVNNTNYLNLSSSVNNTPVFLIAGDQTSVYFDEIRIWNNKRSIDEIGRNWFTSVNGNSEEIFDESNLLVYFKFNEGWDEQYGSLCVDYSGRKNDSYIYNYSTSCRIRSSAIDESKIVQDVERGDIIISGLQYSSVVKDFYNKKILSGIAHDEENIHLLYNKFPGWILEEEEEKETRHLKQIIQIVSSYFDDLYSKISEVTEFKKIKFNNDIDHTYPFYDKILTSMGFDVTDIFNNLTALENISSRNDKTIFDQEIKKIKNTIFQNIYNNLIYIFRSKGTEKSLKSLLRLYGINEDLVRVNLYADKANYGVTDRSKETIIKKKTVTMTGSNSIYLNPLPVPEQKYFTLEACLSFPFGLKPKEPEEISIFGLTNGNNDYYVTAKQVSTNNYLFNFYHTSSTVYNYSCCSYTASNFYDDSAWNICLRQKPNIDKLYDGAASTDNIIELVLINTNTVPEAAISCSLPYITGSGNIYYYIGAKKKNLIGDLLYHANSKFLYCNFWSSEKDIFNNYNESGYLNNNIIYSHNKDILNYAFE